LKTIFCTLIKLIKLCLFCVLIDKIVIRPQTTTGNLISKVLHIGKHLEIAFTATKEDILLVKLTPLSNWPHRIVDIGAARNQNKEDEFRQQKGSKILDFGQPFMTSFRV